MGDKDRRESEDYARSQLINEAEAVKPASASERSGITIVNRRIHPMASIYFMFPCIKKISSRCCVRLR